MSPLKVLLVGNYLPDGQESMLRFCRLLERELLERGADVRVVYPRRQWRRLFTRGGLCGKWLGYIDKYLLFPRELKEAAAWADVVHVCDHSNAIYLPCLESRPNLITCHDLLAVRAACGEKTYCDVSSTGKVLQRWIKSCLPRAGMIVCDSEATKKDALRLLGTFDPANVRVVTLGFNHPYRRLDRQHSARTLEQAGLALGASPYVLSVGDTQPRKNRDGILRIFALVKDKFDGQLVFAGQPLNDQLRGMAFDLGLKERVKEIVKPDNEVLEALYNQAFALLFPSRAEGFGWPIIEAQACGCPVLCSDCGPLPEVAGNSALMRAVDDERGFAADLLSLMDSAERDKWMRLGLENVQRFNSQEMIEKYHEIYEEILVRSQGRHNQAP